MISVICTKYYSVRNKVLTFYIIETENLNNLPKSCLINTWLEQRFKNQFEIYTCIQESILKIN